MSDTEVSPTQQSTQRHIVAATPIAAVVLPPTAQATLVVVVPEPLATDLRGLWAAEDARHAAARFRRFDFSEWLVERLRAVRYGHGEEPGCVRDWQERT